MAFSIRFDLRLTAGRRAADESRDQHRYPTPRPTGLCSRRRGLRPVGRPSGLLQGAQVDRCGRHRGAPDRLVGAGPCRPPLRFGRMGRGARGASQPARRPSPDRHRIAHRRELAALRLRREQRAHPRRKPRLLSQPARERPSRPDRPEGAAFLASMGGGGLGGSGDIGARDRSARPVVDQPHPLRELRDLRAAAEDRARWTRWPDWPSKPPSCSPSPRAG